jgi:serine protease Do
MSRLSTVPASILVGGLALLLACPVAAQQQKTREQKVREDREKIEAEGFWIYNDLARGFAEAKKTGKPLLVVLRCIPCEECVKLDDDLVEQDPVVRPLLDKFVCVRQVSTNGLDLGLFQFDTDQSFAAFLLNADGTIYGRFGTRSHRTEWVGDVSLPGLAQALQGALALHAEYPKNKEALAGKRGPAPQIARPEEYPLLQEKYTSTLNYSGNVVQSCIHCHQIGDAQRDMVRSSGQPIPDKVLFPYPHPKAIGLILDSQERAKVRKVTPDSLAAQAGFEPGDEIARLNGQPILSMADVQWVLHSVDSQGGEVAVDLVRAGQPQSIVLKLPADWRAADDISWRASTWGLRRMSLGGLTLETLPEEERKSADLAEGEMALRVKNVGQYGLHATARNAGFQKGDIIVAVDGRKDLHTEADVLRYGVQEKKAGDRVAISVLREGKRREITLPMQK